VGPGRQALGRESGLIGERSALAGLNVIDLSQRFSHYCGKLFADMGADVILVEKPGSGCALRAEAPISAIVWILNSASRSSTSTRASVA